MNHFVLAGRKNVQDPTYLAINKPRSSCCINKPPSARIAKATFFICSYWSVSGAVSSCTLYKSLMHTLIELFLSVYFLFNYVHGERMTREVRNPAGRGGENISIACMPFQYCITLQQMRLVYVNVSVCKHTYVIRDATGHRNMVLFVFVYLPGA